jgi:hypothetical protein
MKKRNRFRNYLSLEALVILLVLLCFRVIPDKKLASLVTSFLFIASTVGLLYWETRFEGFKKRPSFWGMMIFLIVSALPILAVRLIYWDLPFEQIQIGGLTGDQMHKSSSYVFGLMLVCFFIDSYQEQHREKLQNR